MALVVGVVDLVGHHQLVVVAPNGGSPARIEEGIVKENVRSRVVVVNFSLPGVTVVGAIEDDTIGIACVDDEGDLVIVGGLHPVVSVGAVFDAVFSGEEGKFAANDVPVFTVGRTPVSDGAGNTTLFTTEDSGSHVDDVVVGAGGGHARVRPDVGADVEGSLNTVGRNVVLVLNEVDVQVVGSVCSHGKAVCTVTGDGAETGSVGFNAAFQRSPFVGVDVVGADGGTTVGVVGVAAIGVSEVHFSVGPNNSSVDVAVVGLPVVGSVVEVTVHEVSRGGHHRFANSVLVNGFQSRSLLQGGFVFLDIVSRNLLLLHLREAHGSNQQGQ